MATRSVLTPAAEQTRREEIMARRALARTTDPYMRRMITERMTYIVARNRRSMRREG